MWKFGAHRNVFRKIRDLLMVRARGKRWGQRRPSFSARRVPHRGSASASSKGQAGAFGSGDGTRPPPGPSVHRRKNCSDPKSVQEVTSAVVERSRTRLFGSEGGKTALASQEAVDL
ncbi:hypothetical protein B0H11DRAFT_2182965 [Mycena galericulata]|nr:hypothetical protein B0H11DRAFT_2182965 [Mycena galericulata]